MSFSTTQPQPERPWWANKTQVLGFALLLLSLGWNAREIHPGAEFGVQRPKPKVYDSFDPSVEANKLISIELAAMDLNSIADYMKTTYRVNRSNCNTWKKLREIYDFPDVPQSLLHQFDQLCSDQEDSYKEAKERVESLDRFVRAHRQ